MSITQIHATFVLEREYPVPVARVWEAFADPAVKARWFGSDDFIILSRSDDFRVGGRSLEDSRFGADAPIGRFAATYTDIVEQERIVMTYDMWLDGAHASTSITTVLFEPTAEGTRLTYTEQGVHLDGVHGPGPEAAAGREHGTGELLDQLGGYLAGAFSLRV
ncbi:MAG: SRPBCC family protein [Microbacteriaceae bacterium]|nr:SRPBCC family protein [Microbacteriaceae bacterium]